MEQTRSWFNTGVLFSLLLVLLLQVFPLPHDWLVIRPQLVLLLCCYLILHDTISFNLEFACLTGLLLDLISGSELGRHALALLVPVALLMLIKPRIKYAGLHHEMVIVAILTLMAEIILQGINLIFRDTVASSWVILPAIGALIVWPVLRIIFRLLIPVHFS